MSIYQDILDWSQSRPLFIKDALRRIITNSILTPNDIDELILLLKKENGGSNITLNALPINTTHIPIINSSGIDYPKLINLKNPINISALYDKGNLQFEDDGLSIVYGNNGSGKSSYSRILKKLCWSRNSNIDLKKNLFIPSSLPQKVDFIIKTNGVNLNFQWNENDPTHPALSSIYVFDSDCSDIYINKENPTEYKPVGIDILEKLISTLNIISHKISSEILTHNTTKPILEQPLEATQTGQWYSRLESMTRNEIDKGIEFTKTNLDRKQELFNLISTQNPTQNIQNLTGLKKRIENYTLQFKTIEEQFNLLNIEAIKKLRTDYNGTKKAYDIASNELNGLNTIEGFGTNHWRVLWDSAKNFAHQNGMSNGIDFPSGNSLQKCVLCQQELDEIAKKRLESFNLFIMDDISTKLSVIQEKIKNKISHINSISIPPLENFIELNEHIENFKNQYLTFTNSVDSIKKLIFFYLENDGELDIQFLVISPNINNLIINIDKQLEQNNQLLLNKNKLEIEFNELRTKEFLFGNKVTILKYFDDYKQINWLQLCQSHLNTATVSKKIGDLMLNQAVNLQHNEFINHLNSFNKDLTSKVLLAKTRTSQGNTYQKCTLNGLTDPINSVLSEGEQKIISLSNFLAECTIDGRKNTIIFDDPVTSLDIDYRELIANKIVELSNSRQIIVLTHDLAFVRLLIDLHKLIKSADCQIIGIDKYDGISGIITDEIPYLAKNVDERIDNIRRILREHDSLLITDAHGRETKLDSARKRFRMLLERSVEEILSNKAYERFSKNINLKKGNLSGYIVTERADVDFLLNLFGKYSVTEHDGGTSTIPQLPNKQSIDQDITDYLSWKNAFKTKLKTYIQSYN